MSIAEPTLFDALRQVACQMHDKNHNRVIFFHERCRIGLQKEGGGMIHTTADSLLESISRMPKAELHRHLAGCITPELIVELAERHAVPVPSRDIGELDRLVVLRKPMENLQQVLACFHIFMSLFTSARVVRYVTERVIDDAARDGIRYLELRFSPGFMAHVHGLNLVDVMDAVTEGAAAAAARNAMTVPLIAIASREMGAAVCLETFRLAADYLPRVVAVDLAGDEDGFPPELFVEAFEYARSAGLAATVHAGEQANPGNVRTAVEKLHATRIGHGIRIVDEPEIVALLKDRRVALEISVTSNYIVGAVPSPAEHPVGRLAEAGVPVTINSDDPALFGITLSRELEQYARLWGLSRGDLVRNQLESLDHAFASPTEIGLVRQELHDWWTQA